MATKASLTSSSIDLVRDSTGSAPALTERSVEGRRRSAGHTASAHAHLETVLAAQLEVVHQLRHKVEAAPAGGHQVRPDCGVEAGDVEATAGVLDASDQRAALELQRHLHLVAGATVADGVGAGLFDAEHDLVGKPWVVAVRAEIVADALSGAKQVRRLQSETKRQARELRIGAESPV